MQIKGGGRLSLRQVIMFSSVLLPQQVLVKSSKVEEADS